MGMLSLDSGERLNPTRDTLQLPSETAVLQMETAVSHLVGILVHASHGIHCRICATHSPPSSARNG